MLPRVLGLEGIPGSYPQGGDCTGGTGIPVLLSAVLVDEFDLPIGNCISAADFTAMFQLQIPQSLHVLVSTWLASLSAWD